MNSRSDLPRLALIYVVSIAAASLLYVGSFWVGIYGGNDVLFFRSMGLLLLSGLITICLLGFLKLRAAWFACLTWRDVALIYVLFFSLNQWFYSLVPFNTSRSVSVMIVGYLYQNRDASMTQEEVEKYVDRLYFDKEQAVRRRLDEQVAIGNIEKVEGRYRITSKGLMTAEAMGRITALYNVRKNYILDKQVFPD